MPGKPSIVFAHGLWADGSCFSKVIELLVADGYEVISTQNHLSTVADDAAAVRTSLGRANGPVVLVGHSYGGTVITAAGVDDRVKALVYICALAPDDGDTTQADQTKFPQTPVFQHIEVEPLPACSRQRQRQISKHHTTPIFGYLVSCHQRTQPPRDRWGIVRMKYLREKCVMFRTTYLRTI